MKDIKLKMENTWMYTCCITQFCFHMQALVFSNLKNTVSLAIFWKTILLDTS
jgi:hypothetical protein